MTKPKELKVGDEVKVIGGEDTEHFYPLGTIGIVRRVWDDGSAWVVRNNNPDNGQAISRENLRKLPDRKEGLRCPSCGAFCSHDHDEHSHHGVRHECLNCLSAWHDRKEGA